MNLRKALAILERPVNTRKNWSYIRLIHRLFTEEKIKLVKVHYANRLRFYNSDKIDELEFMSEKLKDFDNWSTFKECIRIEIGIDTVEITVWNSRDPIDRRFNVSFSGLDDQNLENFRRSIEASLNRKAEQILEDREEAERQRQINAIIDELMAKEVVEETA